jgi:hypothetical protein
MWPRIAAPVRSSGSDGASAIGTASAAPKSAPASTTSASGRAAIQAPLRQRSQASSRKATA